MENECYFEIEDDDIGIIYKVTKIMIIGSQILIQLESERAPLSLEYFTENEKEIAKLFNVLLCSNCAKK